MTSYQKYFHMWDTLDHLLSSAGTLADCIVRVTASSSTGIIFAIYNIGTLLIQMIRLSIWPQLTPMCPRHCMFRSLRWSCHGSLGQARGYVHRGHNHHHRHCNHRLGSE